MDILIDAANAIETLSDSGRNAWDRLKQNLGIEKKPEALQLGRNHDFPVFGGDLHYNTPEAKLYDTAMDVVKPIVKSGKISEPISVEQGRALIFAEEFLYATGCEKDAKAVGWVLDQAVSGPNGRAINELVHGNGGRPTVAVRAPNEMDIAIERSFGSSLGDTQVTTSARTKNTVIAKARMGTGAQ